MERSPVCVYFLVRAGAVVYVGKSKCVEKRVQQHRVARKVFDAVYVLPCALEDVDYLEAGLIIRMRPELNNATPLVDRDRTLKAMSRYGCAAIPSADCFSAPAFNSTEAFRKLLLMLEQRGDRGMSAKEIASAAGDDPDLRMLLSGRFNGWLTKDLVIAALHGRLWSAVVDGKHVKLKSHTREDGRLVVNWVVGSKEPDKCQSTTTI